jgi:ribosomal-protein-alanine N-acetyltransferase
MGDFVIRFAELADVAALAEIEQQCFAIPWSEAALRQDLGENSLAHYFVAQQQDGQILGYASCWQVLDQAQINNVAVRPAARRGGVARSLLQALISWADSAGIRQLDLEVRVGNLAARQLYRGAGFTDAGLRRSYYADNGEDAIIMLKNIEG